MTTDAIREPGARALSLVEIKAMAFDAIRQSELWSQKAKALAAEIQAREDGPVASNGVALQGVLDTEKVPAAS